jgi:hypothetical protein
VDLRKKVFWSLFIVLGLLADMMFSLTWSLVATIPILFLSWWIAYRSGWID